MRWTRCFSRVRRPFCTLKGQRASTPSPGSRRIHLAEYIYLRKEAIGGAGLSLGCRPTPSR